MHLFLKKKKIIINLVLPLFCVFLVWIVTMRQNHNIIMANKNCGALQMFHVPVFWALTVATSCHHFNTMEERGLLVHNMLMTFSIPFFRGPKRKLHSTLFCFCEVKNVLISQNLLWGDPVSKAWQHSRLAGKCLLEFLVELTLKNTKYNQQSAHSFLYTVTVSELLSNHIKNSHNKVQEVYFQGQNAQTRHLLIMQYLAVVMQNHHRLMA